MGINPFALAAGADVVRDDDRIAKASRRTVVAGGCCNAVTIGDEGRTNIVGTVAVNNCQRAI